MCTRWTSQAVAAGLALSALAVLPSTAAETPKPGKPVIASAAGPVRYPAYPVAKRIEPIVLPRASLTSAVTRKGVTTASAPKKIAAPKAVSAKAASGKVPLAGKSALGAPLPSIKAAKPKGTAKPAAARR